MLHISFGAGAATRYGSGSGSTKMMQLFAGPALQHSLFQFVFLKSILFLVS
jgi:hypothetical protein